MTTSRTLAAHVFRRLGFGPSPADLDTWSAADPDTLIDDILARPTVVPTAADPNPWGFPTNSDYTAGELFASRMVQLMAFGPAQGGATYSPLQERMAWILNGILVVSTIEGLELSSIADHVCLLRSSCFGSYSSLLREVSKRPAMIRYLSGCVNTAEHPNQNYAREIMELFSLGRVHPLSGQPNYTQADVVELARALTGWRLDWITGGVVFNSALWDHGPKTFFGKPMGKAGLDEVIAAIVAHPSWPYFVPLRVYTDLVGLPPAVDVLEELAAAFGPTGDLGALVATIVSRPEFVADQAIFTRVKQPVELIASASRFLGLSAATLAAQQLPSEMRFTLMQHPLMAPGVAGWPRGDQWLGAGSLVGWSRVAAVLVRASMVSGETSLPARLYSEASCATAGDRALQLAGLDNASPATRAKLDDYALSGPWTKGRAAGVAALLLHSPEFLVN